MAKVLVTSVGSGVGQSVVDSLNLTNKHIVLGCSNDRNIYAYHFCKEIFIVPAVSEIGYIDYILNLCIKEKIDLIIPGYDKELLLFSKNKFKFEEKGIEIIVSLPDLIEVSRDKYEWYKYFSKYGCAVVPTYKVGNFKESPTKAILPAIVKPSAGSASQGISIINHLDELKNTKDDDIIQPYLFPSKDDINYNKIVDFVKRGKFLQVSEISIQLVFTRESELGGIFISNNILKGGVPVFINPIDPKEFEYLDDIMKFAKVCKDKKVVGPVNIQGRLNEEGLTCFEMNMRFTGITGNRAQLGFNEVAFLVDNFLGKESKLEGFAKNKLGVRQVASTTIPRVKSDEKTYTILGGGGFIGSSLVHELINTKEKKQINLICRETSYEKYLEIFKNDNVDIFKNTDEYLTTIICKTDILVNFASALAHQSEEEKYSAIIFQQELVQKIIKANIPLVINISSQSVYNQRLNIIKDEDSEIVVNNSYAFQKYITENFYSSIESFCPNTKVITLRLARVIGANYMDNIVGGFFVKIIEKALEGEEIQISEPNNNTNLIDVRDVLDAILFIVKIDSKALELPKILNVGGTNVSLKEYCNMVVNSLRQENKKLVYSKENKDCSISSMINSDRIKELGWSNKYSLQETITKIIELSK